MVDQRFYPEANPLSVTAITELVRGEKYRGSGSLMARMVAPAGVAEAGAVCFVESNEVAAKVANEKGIICLASPDVAANLGKNIAVIITPDPKRGFGVVLAAMYPQTKAAASIHPSANIAEGVKLGEGVQIDAGATIEHGVELGDRVWVKSGATIGQSCSIGNDTIINMNAAVMFSIIGANCQIGVGATIGFSGFGIGRDHGGNMLIPHIGRVIIGNNVEVGANSTIDRGFIEDTEIGDHVMIDNLVQIGHNVKLGSGNVICAMVGIAGSSVLGDNNIFGAQAGVADHITIGSGNVFAARAGVTKNVGDGIVMAGFPAVSAHDFRREVATLRRLASSKKTTRSK